MNLAWLTTSGANETAPNDDDPSRILTKKFVRELERVDWPVVNGNYTRKKMFGGGFWMNLEDFYAWYKILCEPVQLGAVQLGAGANIFNPSFEAQSKGELKKHIREAKSADASGWDITCVHATGSDFSIPKVPFYYTVMGRLVCRNENTKRLKTFAYRNHGAGLAVGLGYWGNPWDALPYHETIGFKNFEDIGSFDTVAQSPSLSLCIAVCLPFQFLTVHDFYRDHEAVGRMYSAAALEVGVGVEIGTFSLGGRTSFKHEDTDVYASKALEALGPTYFTS